MKPLNSNGRYGILGTTGSGKSNSTWVLTRNLLEQGRPVVILDHKGEYLTMPGLVAKTASELSPKSLPMRLRNSNVSLAVSLKSHANPTQWVRDFILSCLRLPRKVPLLVIIEEAHNYVPQKGKADGCRQAVNNLASEGRSQGYGLVMVSQRCSKIDKDALTQCDALYIHRHHFKTDLDYLEDFIGRDRRTIVEGLPTGEILHLDMKGGYIFERFSMPEATEKTQGRTPESVPVRANVDAFYQALPYEYPKGKYAYQPASMGVIIVVVIVIVLTVFLSYLAIKGTKDEPTGYEGLTEGQEPPEAMPF